MSKIILDSSYLVHYNAKYAKHTKKVIPQGKLFMDMIKQLEAYRLENRITQVALAKEIGVNFSTVSRWLNGKTTPNKIQ